MRTLYFDCFSGISGDMTLGALLDLGLDFEYLKSELKKLPLEGYQLQVSRIVRANISATKIDVLIEGDSHGHHHDHDRKNHHAHDHERPHAHEEHDHRRNRGHDHRKASDIFKMIGASGLNPNAKRIGSAIFSKLAISEGKVHQIAPEDVEFHEVGAIDSIVDTVGAAIGFDALGIERFRCSPINVGSGFIHCQHGIYPVPAPATADLLQSATIYSKYATTELVTPTGAAILAAVVDRFAMPEGFVIDRIGYGAGSKDLGEFPNCLRLMTGHETSMADREDTSEILVIEANIDDMTGQNLAYTAEKLHAAGALDVFTIPVQMKKGRLGYLLQVLAPNHLFQVLGKMIFEETTTIGIRHYPASRTILERELLPVETRYGRILVKIARFGGQLVNFTPEYEDCARVAREQGIPLKAVQLEAARTYMEQTGQQASIYPIP